MSRSQTRADSKGRCDACDTTYHWNGKPLHRDARCPVHLTPLKRSSFGAKGKHIHRAPATAERPRLVLREVAS